MLGRGPSGLAFAIRAKASHSSREIEVYDRNPAGARYGFGGVFSDEAMGAIVDLDPEVHAAVVCDDARWTEIDIPLRGRT